MTSLLLAQHKNCHVQTMAHLNVKETALLMLAVHVLEDQLEELEDGFQSLLARHIREQRRLNRSLPEEKKRVPWSHFCSSLTDHHFRRMFRMEVLVFSKLCSMVCEKVGEDTFRPEAYLMEKVDNGDDLKGISGEVKVALCIRMLSGGSYLDLVPLFDVSTTHLYRTFGTFLKWILLTLEFPLVAWLRERNWKALESLANSFAEKSNGVFYGPFGAIDGLAIRIKSPIGVSDPGNYYCRKGFYALNVQAICDRSKRFLWVYPSNKGSTHDAAAFAASRLLDLLEELSEELYERSLFIAGDSAYSLTPYLVVPYDTAHVKEDPTHARDAFNFYLSSCRIHIECAFGELVMRWGIFWRTLLFKDLKKNCEIVQAAMLLQNFIIENRGNGIADGAYFSNFRVDSSEPLQVTITRETGESPIPLVTDNNEPRGAGRRTLTELAAAEKAEAIRKRLTTALSVNGMSRPMQDDMRYNAHGHIYMTS